MINKQNHLINDSTSLKEALGFLNHLAEDAILFVINSDDRLIGSLTDGDVRRGLIKGNTLDDNVYEFMHTSPKSIQKDDYTIYDILELKKEKIKIFPVIDKNRRVIKIINLKFFLSHLPLDVVLMAGGRGSRLRPMTDSIPKPLLKVGNKTIIDHNFDRLKKFGIDVFHISVRYLGEQLEEHFKKKNLNDINVDFIWEEDALGTIGALSLIDKFRHDHILIMNSDLLTNINYENFYMDFLENNADMSVATIPYKVNIPYAVIETNDKNVISLKEKPTYTYQSNAGIYIVKREILNNIPKKSFYNATDLMQKIINKGGSINYYPIHNYWLDIGKHDDFEKAQNDIINLDMS